MLSCSSAIGSQTYTDIHELTQIVSRFGCTFLRKAVKAVRKYVNLFAISRFPAMIEYGICQSGVSVGIRFRFIHLLPFLHIVCINQILSRAIATLSTLQADWEIQFLQFVGITNSFNQNHFRFFIIIGPQQSVK